MGSAKIESSLSRIEINNQVPVREFLEERKARMLSENTLKSYAGALMKADIELDHKPFVDWTKHDCRKLLNSVENPNSKNALGIVLKTFMRWLDKGEEIAWWKPTQSFGTLPDLVPSVEEIRLILKAIDDTKYRSFFHVLYDSGARVGSLLAVKKYQVSFDADGAYIVLPTSKTGLGLHLRLTSSHPILLEWYNQCSASPDDPLWRISYDSVNRRFHTAVKKAGIQKPFTIHSLRHARATDYARGGMNELCMRQHFGWKAGSRMTEKYTHLSSRDLDAAVFKASGMKVSEKEIAVGLKPVICQSCGKPNDPTYSFCAKCSASLTGATATIDELTTTFKRLIASSELTESLGKIGQDMQQKGVISGSGLQLVLALGDMSNKVVQAVMAAKQLDAAAELERVKKIRKPRAKAAMPWAESSKQVTSMINALQKKSKSKA